MVFEVCVDVSSVRRVMLYNGDWVLFEGDRDIRRGPAGTE